MDGASLTVRGHGTLGHRELIIDDNRDDCGFSCALVCFLDRAFCLLFACLMMLAAGCWLHAVGEMGRALGVGHCLSSLLD